MLAWGWKYVPVICVGFNWKQFKVWLSLSIFMLYRWSDRIHGGILERWEWWAMCRRCAGRTPSWMVCSDIGVVGKICFWPLPGGTGREVWSTLLWRLWPVSVWRWSCRSRLCVSSLENEEAFVFQEWSDLEGELTARKSSLGACWREESPMEFCWPHALLAILPLCLSSNSNERRCVRSPSCRGATDISCLQLFT